MNDSKYDNFKNINKTCNNIRKKVCLSENKISNKSVKRLNSFIGNFLCPNSFIVEFCFKKC